jgi:hypothetical protein
MLDRSGGYVCWAAEHTETSILALLLRDIGSEDVSLE